ncbi:MAG: efflux RND transporter periplasmic adaptor subunit [Lewinellaceae bacterium]|nr:efflux RND transporter periplasmic adaptor subunit [Lewinellaceae bacterium]
MKNTFKQALLFSLVLIVGVSLGWLLFGRSHEEHPLEETTVAAGTVWTCSMHPQIRANEPGKCPICGMDLIPLQTEDGSEGAGPDAIPMSNMAIQLANVQTMVVSTGSAIRELHLNGKVVVDERRVYAQSVHFGGRVERLSVNFTGEPVNQGQTVARIYSPELSTAQEELLEAAKMKATQPGLLKAAYAKLKNLKLSDAQIDSIVSTGKTISSFPVRADVSGIVMEKHVSLGDYVATGTPIYTIADLSKVWVLFDLYESDLAWVKKGNKIDFSVPSFPGESFQGTVAYIDPVLDPMTRVATARIEMPNRGWKLKPGMFVSGTIKGRMSGAATAMVVPKTAVLWTGERSVVYVKTKDSAVSAFILREITLGPALGDGYEVKNRLQLGEEIVVNGTFAVDAAAQLAGKPSMMSHATANASVGAGGSKSAANGAANAAIGKILDAYLALKDALVNSDLSAASSKAKQMLRQVEQTDMSLFSDKNHVLWMQQSDQLKKGLNTLIAAKNLVDARTVFLSVSNSMAVLARNFGPFPNTVFVQHCPMALDGKGADWLSLDPNIRNPYFGEAMLKCGETTEKIQ